MQRSLLAMIPLAVATSFAADFPAPADLPRQEGFPDVLAARDGTAITSKEQWEKQRKPELRALFEHYMYGRQLGRPAGMKHTLRFEDKAALNGTATVREFDVQLGLDHPVRLLVVTPNAPSGPRPCFLGLNFYGNHQVLAHPGIALPEGWVRPNKDGTGGKKARDEDRGKQTDVWNVATIIQRGYAFASFFQSDLVPDDAPQATAAIAQLATAAGVGKPEAGAETATIMAWAWGFSRMLDVLEKLPEIDARKVATVGHSRNGKTALLAAAYDERFALAIPSQAGCGGTGPSRVAPELAKKDAKGRGTAETIDVINKSFPHWFADNFKGFNEDPARLPFDQHCLAALCAPRPVLFSNATEDQWANPAGQFEMLKLADPVYRLLGVDGIGQTTQPEISKLLPSRLGYFIRPGKHSMATEDWNAWLDYADRWLK